MPAKKKKKKKAKKATVARSTGTSMPMVKGEVSPAWKNWLPPVLAAIIIVLAFVSTAWARWLVVIAAAVIFLLGVSRCSKK